MTLISIAEPLLRYRGGVGMPPPTDEGEGKSASLQISTCGADGGSVHLRRLQH